MAKRKGLFLLGAAAAAAGTGLYTGNKIYERVVVPRQHDDSEPDFDEAVTEGRRFLHTHPDRQDVYLESIDLLKLHAILLESDKAGEDTHRYVILVHGYGDHSEGMGIFAKHYLEQGIHTLIPDLRGFGASEGSYVGFGYDERLDMIEWIYWLLRRDHEAKIVLHGVSMGAATVLMTSGEHLPACVRAIIADSSYSDLRDELCRVNAANADNPIPFSVTYELLRLETKIRAGYDMEDCSPVEAVRRSDTPTLFLHGDGDRLIPVSMVTRLYEEARCEKHMAVFPGADHIRAVVTNAEEYWEQVDKMLGEASLL